MLTPSRGFSDSAGGIPRNCLKDALRPQKPYVLDRIWRNGAARWNAAPQGRIDSKRNPFLMLSHLGNAGNAGARPRGRAKTAPLPSLKTYLRLQAAPCRNRQGVRPVHPQETQGRYVPGRHAHGLPSIVPTQQVDAHIRLAGIEGRRTPRAGGRRGCRRKRPGVQPGL